ncbi:hypothetical protein M5K25_013813 [Dendrobium thyrsiflorum]|uniref:Uncharacterized protein n=1 Tax=Dendrobium thyrsiflorum TaxID=117978 RepID=A0ABD0V163_DENTH
MQNEFSEEIISFFTTIIYCKRSIFLQFNLTSQVPGVHCKAAKGKNICKRGEAMYHPKLLVHGCKLRVHFCRFRIFRPPDLLADAQVPFDLVPFLHHLCISILPLWCMADPDVDHGFLDNEQGLVDILRSSFFDPNPEIDDTVDNYIERIIFTLAPSIEEHLPTGYWRIIGRPSTSPPPATSLTNYTVSITCLPVASLGRAGAVVWRVVVGRSGAVAWRAVAGARVAGARARSPDAVARLAGALLPGARLRAEGARGSQARGRGRRARARGCGRRVRAGRRRAGAVAGRAGAVAGRAGAVARRAARGCERRVRAGAGGEPGCGFAVANRPLYIGNKEVSQQPQYHNINPKKRRGKAIRPSSEFQKIPHGSAAQPKRNVTEIQQKKGHGSRQNRGEGGRPSGNHIIPNKSRYSSPAQMLPVNNSQKHGIAGNRGAKQLAPNRQHKSQTSGTGTATENHAQHREPKGLIRKPRNKKLVHSPNYLH